ncbi:MULTISPECIES: hemin uptake protein HemP [unclassified Undibacterium]|uniref:hemin uptake protein HemP n=1 Tax=unclassified Undibacterium TaxID=2630295 RepID=UPI002AC9BF8F|nr:MULTISPECIES: hemin uptake protein HemP [unclassified Undibacterium]MEB0139233.1 hemin uptake protein HemP [Undibacterium sp. CCC2.1]MEB0172077.1 hemin uptake protein HemP [Undibacterium sp. CCC1.1]MEB0175952.1 hemin uptake protein HemP [Undibacterium sp. CCC3.4]MEB0215264.1 hemin uptake protein HemP [Undibacterium sp. 5I2]WPX45439.1 hemin uptake protein HemP [Undibacterium sp. CCC3.4]
MLEARHPSSCQPDVTSASPQPCRPSISGSIPRLKSCELMQREREIEIDHEGKIYHLRLTRLNKLILTA